VWVFGTAAPLDEAATRTLLDTVDRYLDGWRAHGDPLTSARDWRDDRFLTIAVDSRESAASGCSLDALYRMFKQLEPSLGGSLLDGSRVYYRDASGTVQATDRPGFAALARSGVVDAHTPVFDLAVTQLGDWRHRFESPAAESWHSALLPQSPAEAR
jgi:hypothetical protein